MSDAAKKAEDDIGMERVTFRAPQGLKAEIENVVDESPRWASLSQFCRCAVRAKFEEEDDA